MCFNFDKNLVFSLLLIFLSLACWNKSIFENLSIREKCQKRLMIIECKWISWVFFANNMVDLSVIVCLVCLNLLLSSSSSLFECVHWCVCSVLEIASSPEPLKRLALIFKHWSVLFPLFSYFFSSSIKLLHFLSNAIYITYNICWMSGDILNGYYRFSTCVHHTRFIRQIHAKGKENR